MAEQVVDIIQQYDEDGNPIAGLTPARAVYDPDGTSLDVHLSQNLLRGDKEQQLADIKKERMRKNLGFGNGQIDSRPTPNSSNIVTSGGVAAAIQEVQDQVDNADENLQSFMEATKEQVSAIAEDIQPIVIEGDVDNAPDEEDLTIKQIGESTYVLKFKDRVYSPLTYSGMGRVILRKNMVSVTLTPFGGFLEGTPTIESGALEGEPTTVVWEPITGVFLGVVEGGLNLYYAEWENDDAYKNLRFGDAFTYDNGYYVYDNGSLVPTQNPPVRNTLTQDMLYKGEVGSRVPNTNTVFVIRYDFDLGGNTVTIPDNSVLEFDGGSLSNGTVAGQNTEITGAPRISATTSGTWSGIFTDIKDLDNRLKASGDTRPTSDLYIGYQFFDTTLGTPIYWNGANWVDATGTTV